MKKGWGGMRVMVIGAGLGGLTLAHGLRRAGVDVVVYERDEAAGRPQGVALHLDDRGSAALRGCLPPSHFALVEATMGGPRDRTLMVSEVDGKLAVTGSVPSDGGPGRARPGRQLSRGLLRAVLLHGLHDAVRFGARFTGFERCADGGVRAWFADGRTDQADVLVGADGIGSAVRRRYLPHVRVVDTGKRMLMGATALRRLPDGELPGLIGDNPAGVRVRGATMALGALRFRQRPVAARDRWLPSLRAPAVTTAEDFLLWAIPTSADRAGPAETGTAVHDRARDLMAHNHPALRAVVAGAWPQVTVALRIGVIPPMPAWPVTPVTLLGDAIHLAPGFGGNLAMRDAHRLCRALTEAAAGRRDLLAAIGGYEETMRRDGFAAGGPAPRGHEAAPVPGARPPAPREEDRHPGERPSTPRDEARVPGEHPPEPRGHDTVEVRAVEPGA